MLFNKRPLIYMPKKRKKVIDGGGTIHDVFGGLWLDTQYLNYDTSMRGLRPSIICYTLNPIRFHTTQFILNNKPISGFQTGSGKSVTFIPIVSKANGVNFVSRASSIRWAPLPLDRWTSTAMWSVPYAFYIPDADPNIYKFKDSGDNTPYTFSQRIDDEAIAGTSNPTFMLRKLNGLSDMQRFYNKLNGLNITMQGSLIVTDNDYSTWTDATLLDFANIFLQENYGHKTAVVELDLAT